MDKWLRNVTFVRITALLLGILLWAVVHLSEQSPTDLTTPPLNRTDEIFDVSITSIGLDEDLFEVTVIDPTSVTLELTGRESALRRVNLNDYKVVLDLSQVKPGTQSLPLSARGFPSGVQVTMIPDTVKVVAEAMDKKEMQVAISLTGTPGAGYKAGQPIVNPNRVHVTLPSSRLDEIETVGAELDIEGAQSAVKKEVKLVAFNKAGKPVEAAISPAVVAVEVPITSPFKTMPLRIKLIGQPPAGFSVAEYSQDVDEVTVYGPQDVLDELDFYDVLEINLQNLRKDKSFSFDIPLKAQLNKVEPVKVNVDISVVPSITRTLEQFPITLSGQNDQYVTRVTSPSNGRIDLELEGAPTVLSRLKSSDIQVIADVSNLPPGKHEIELNLNLPIFVKKSSQQSSLWVNVEISTEGSSVEPTEPVVVDPDANESDDGDGGIADNGDIGEEP